MARCFDEIGNISEAMQVRLLRVIQERQITRVGGVRPIDVDVRCLVATNADLQAMVREGGFRADLFHRLNVVTITMPPLRERREDIPALLQHFVSQFAAEYGRDVVGFDAASVRRLERYPWPGNVRELKPGRTPCGPGGSANDAAGGPARRPGDAAAASDDLPTLAELEWRYIQQVLQHCDGNRGRAAAPGYRQIHAVAQTRAISACGCTAAVRSPDLTDARKPSSPLPIAGVADCNHCNPHFARFRPPRAQISAITD